MIALDALSAYWIVSHTTKERGLNVTLSSIGRSGFKSHELQLNNHQVQGLEEELQVSHSLTWLAMPPPTLLWPGQKLSPFHPQPCGIPTGACPDILVGRYLLSDLEKVT